MNSIAPWVADCKSSQYFLFVVWVPAFAPPPPRLTTPRNLVYKRAPLIEPGFAIVFYDSMATTSGNSANSPLLLPGRSLASSFLGRGTTIIWIPENAAGWRIE